MFIEKQKGNVIFGVLLFLLAVCILGYILIHASNLADLERTNKITESIRIIENQSNLSKNKLNVKDKELNAFLTENMGKKVIVVSSSHYNPAYRNPRALTKIFIDVGNNYEMKKLNFNIHEIKNYSLIAEIISDASVYKHINHYDLSKELKLAKYDLNRLLEYQAAEEHVEDLLKKGKRMHAADIQSAFIPTMNPNIESYKKGVVDSLRVYCKYYTNKGCK